MIKLVIKVLLITTFGLSILLLIPSLFLPIANVIDAVLDAQLTSLMNTIYDILPSQLMTLLIMQFSTVVIIIILRFIFGSRR